MEKTFSEVVIEGPFILVKVFLIGFRTATDPFTYFFHRKAGIRRETLRDVMVELFELENLVHVCVEDRVVGPLREAVADASQKIGIRLHSVRHIVSAEFRFSFETYNEKIADECSFLTGVLPDGVGRRDYESYGAASEDDGVRISLATLAYPFVSGARGVLYGDFESIIELYLRGKRSSVSEHIMTGEVLLTLSDDVEAVLTVLDEGKINW